MRRSSLTERPRVCQEPPSLKLEREEVAFARITPSSRANEREGAGDLVPRGDVTTGSVVGRLRERVQMSTMLFACLLFRHRCQTRRSSDRAVAVCFSCRGLNLLSSPGFVPPKCPPTPPLPFFTVQITSSGQVGDVGRRVGPFDFVLRLIKLQACANQKIALPVPKSPWAVIGQYVKLKGVVALSKGARVTLRSVDLT